MGFSLEPGTNAIKTTIFLERDERAAMWYISVPFPVGDCRADLTLMPAAGELVRNAEIAGPICASKKYGTASLKSGPEKYLYFDVCVRKKKKNRKIIK